LQNVYGRNGEKVKQKPQFLQRNSREIDAHKNECAQVAALNFGSGRKNIDVLVCVLNFGSVQNNIGVQVRTLNFGITQKNVGVRVRALNLALCGVKTHNKVHTVCTHMIMVHVVCIVLAKCRGARLVRTQCGYMLSRNNFVNSAHKVLEGGGGILNFGMMQRVE
jgi:hypothetical protein